jgi:hypothetical protein
VHLAFTEAWERLPYDGMTAPPVLYIVKRLLPPAWREKHGARDRGSCAILAADGARVHSGWPRGRLGRALAGQAARPLRPSAQTIEVER